MAEPGVRIGKVSCVAQSARAICVNPGDAESRETLGAASVWIPQSQIHDDSEVYQDGQVGVLVTTRWWAEKQGWA